MSVALKKYERKKKRIRINGIFYAIISSASFGFSPIFSLSLIAAGLSNFEVLSYRWATAAIVLMIYAFCKKKSLKLSSFDELWKIVLLSILRSITSVTLLIGYANIASGIASTINFMYPVVVALCMMLFFGEQKSPINFISILASIFGVYLLASGDGLKVADGNTALGLTCRKQKDIVTAQEITDAFRRIFPDDPCLGDFALFGYGVTNGTNGQKDDIKG